MRKLLANNTIMLAAAGFVALCGLTIGLGTRDFSWFARFGSVVTCVGIIIISRPSIVGKDILTPVVLDKSGLKQRDPEYYRRRNEPIPDWVLQDVKSRNAVGVYGPLVTLLGTVIWGFADLLNAPFGFHH